MDTHSDVPDQHNDHSIDFTVDGEQVTTTARELTPRQILTLAKIDPATHYLVQIDGRHRVSYEAEPDTPIHVHEDAKFISVSTGPTPVS